MNMFIAIQTTFRKTNKPNMRKLLFISISLCCFSLISRSQDKIYRQNGKMIEAKIIEVGSSEIKYREFASPDGPIYVLETDRIKKIVYENGKEEKFVENIKDPERYTGQRTKAIKVNFLSPLYGYTEIGFEKSTGVGKGYELSLGIIGAGKAGIIDYYYTGSGTGNFYDVKKDPFGVFVSAGYKFGKLPDFLLFGKSKYTHLMQGTYIKPVIYVGNYSENRIVYKGNNQYEVGKQNVTFGALQVEFGRQWVFGERFLLDTYWGLGYGFDNKKDIYDDPYNYYWENQSAYNYANARGGKSPGISGTWGIKLGWLLK
jgi:hypothetical protein